MNPSFVRFKVEHISCEMEGSPWLVKTMFLCVDEIALAVKIVRKS